MWVLKISIFHFVEKRDLTLTEHPNHVAVYLTRYQAVYAE